MFARSLISLLFWLVIAPIGVGAQILKYCDENPPFNCRDVTLQNGLPVLITGGAGSGGTSATDGAGFTPGASAGTPAMGVVDDTAPSTVAEDKVGAVRMTPNRALHVNLRNQDGSEASVGGGSGGTQYDQGTVATDTDKLMMAGCVRADSAAPATGVADGDRARCIIDGSNRIWVRVGTIDGGTITGITNPVAVTQSGAWSNVGVTGPLTDGQLRATPVSVDTELPTAAAAGDGAGNPTAPVMQGFLSGWNGTGWDRLRSTIANGLVVDVSRVQGSVAVTGTFFQATQPVSAVSLPLPTGAATAANQDGIIRDGAGDTTQANVSNGRLHVDSSGVTQPVSGPLTDAQLRASAVPVSLASTVNVDQISSAAIFAGQAAVTASAVALPSTAAKEVCVKALLANTINIFVGPTGVTTSTGMELGPGDAYCSRVTNANALFVVASTTGASVSYAGR